MQSLMSSNKIILSGFKAASITEVVESAKTVLDRIENLSANSRFGQLFMCYIYFIKSLI